MADSEDRKSALIAQLAAQRARLSRHGESVKESADVGARMKASFAGNRAVWLAGAAIGGLALARLRPGRKTVKINTGTTPQKAAVGAAFLLPVAKLLFDLARPALVSMLTASVADFAAGRTAPRRNGPR